MAYLPIKLRQAKDFPVVCKVVLIPDKKFVPGDTVQGKLIVSHKKEGMLIKGLKLSVEGSSFAKFQEREQIHHKTEVFFSQSVYLVGGEQNTKTRLPPGTNSYTFKVKIPEDARLPSTFKSSVGFVLYQVLAIIDTGNAACQQLKKGEKPIVVRGTLEITEEESNNGIDFEKIESKSFGTSSRPTTAFKYLFNTTSSGYALGDEIPFRLTIVNEKMYELKYASVSLVQKVTYYGGTVSRAWKDVYQVVAEVANENNMAETWFGILPVGKDLPISFTGGVVEFRYMIRVIVDTKEGATLKSEHPVTIGTTYKVGPRSQELRAEDFDRMSLCSSVVGTASTSGSSQGYPPRYSTLSLRTHGGSFETLPPEYENTIDEGAEKESKPEAEA